MTEPRVDNRKSWPHEGMMVNICDDIDEGGRSPKCRVISFDSLTDEEKQAFELNNPLEEDDSMVEPASLTGPIVESHKPDNAMTSVEDERDEATGKIS